MVNGIISFISISALSLLVYRNARNFCTLILYLETLPNSLISSGSFLVASLEFHMYSMSSASSDSFTTSFTIFFLNFFSDCRDRIKNTMLNKNGNNGHPCLIFYLRGNALSFSPLRMMFAVSLSYMTCIILR